MKWNMKKQGGKLIVVVFVALVIFNAYLFLLESSGGFLKNGGDIQGSGEFVPVGEGGANFTPTDKLNESEQAIQDQVDIFNDDVAKAKESGDQEAQQEAEVNAIEAQFELVNERSLQGGE